MPDRRDVTNGEILDNVTSGTIFWLRPGFSADDCAAVAPLIAKAARTNTNEMWSVA